MNSLSKLAVLNADALLSFHDSSSLAQTAQFNLSHTNNQQLTALMLNAASSSNFSRIINLHLNNMRF